MTLAIAKSEFLKHVSGLPNQQDVQDLNAITTRVQLQQFLAKRSPPLSSQHIQEILAAFDAP